MFYGKIYFNEKLLQDMTGNHYPHETFNWVLPPNAQDGH